MWWWSPPSSLCLSLSLKAIIVHIFKKWDKNQTDNYKGISLRYSVWSASVIQVFLIKYWLLGLKITRNWRKHRPGSGEVIQQPTIISSSHWMLLLKSVLPKEVASLYACFVDLKKAFDSVQRGPLIDILQQSGLSGKFMNALDLVAIYKSVVSCVRVKDKLTNKNWLSSWIEARLCT